MAKKENIFNKLDGHCAYCGKKISLKKATMDHIIPKSLGGSNAAENLLPACKHCNLMKGSSSLEAFRVDFFKGSLSAEELSSKEKMLNAISKKRFYFEKDVPKPDGLEENIPPIEDKDYEKTLSEIREIMDLDVGFRAMMKVFGLLCVCHYVFRKCLEEFYEWSAPVVELDERQRKVEMAADEFGRTRGLFLDLVELRYRSRDLKSLSAVTTSPLPEREIIHEIYKLEKSK